MQKEIKLGNQSFPFIALGMAVGFFNCALGQITWNAYPNRIDIFLRLGMN